MDRPISLQTEAGLSLVGLGIAAWLLGDKIGRGTVHAITFAVILACSVGGLLDYVVSARGDGRR